MSDDTKNTDAAKSEDKATEEPIADAKRLDDALTAEGDSPKAEKDADAAMKPDNEPSADLDEAADEKALDAKGPAHASDQKEGKPSPAKVAGIIIAIVVVVAIIVACCLMFMQPAEEEAAEPVQAEEPAATEASEESDLPQSPIDWAEWQGINDNVYAWVSVPDTGIELPVLQHPVVENYYLEHDIYGNSTIAGAIYSQKTYNSKDFQSDPVTVLYGHTIETNDTMFTQLHMLEDEVFFDEHPNFYIYTPEYNLTYEIISAYEWDNKLILAKYDVHNLDTQQQYFDIVADPESTNKNVRAMDRLIAGEDHIVQLSTCTVPSNSNKRYLVTGVLVGAEPVASDGVTATEKDEAVVQ